MLEKGIQHHLTLPKSLNIIKALNEMLDGDQTFIQHRFADRRHSASCKTTASAHIAAHPGCWVNTLNVLTERFMK